MSTFDYASLVTTAQALITRFGRTATLVRFDPQAADDNKPWDGPTDPRSDGSIAAVLAATSGHNAAIWDLQSTATIFQDAAQTIPANVGDEVRSVVDLSGNGWDLGYFSGPVATLQNDGTRNYLSQPNNSFYAANFRGGTVVSFAHSFQAEDGDGTYRAYLDNLGTNQGWILETSGINTDQLVFSTGNGTGFDFDHPIDGNVDEGQDMLVFGQVKSNDFIISKAGEADATATANTYVENLASGTFVGGYGATRLFRTALVGVELTSDERNSFETWAAGSGDNSLSIDAAFVPPSGASQLGLSTEVTDLLRRSEQILIVSPGTTVDLRGYNELIDNGVRYKVDMMETLKPGDDIVLNFIGVSR